MTASEQPFEAQAPAGVVALFEAHRPFAEADQRMRGARLAEPTVDGDARRGQRNEQRKRQHHALLAVFKVSGKPATIIVTWVLNAAMR
jgi:hypothetical protein